MNNPVISHSELTDEIYVHFGSEKYLITPYVLSAVKATHKAVLMEDIDAAIAEIVKNEAELIRNARYHATEVAENGRMIAKGLDMALGIIKEHIEK